MIEQQQLVPRWLPRACLVVCGLGLLDSAYLTFEHFTASSTLACSESGAVNCLKVTTSSYSTIVGVPLPLLGFVFFAVMALLCLPKAWLSGGRSLPVLRITVAGFGVVAVLYLIWVELFRLNAICLWCTGVHLLTIVLFALVALGQALAPSAHAR